LIKAAANIADVMIVQVNNDESAAAEEWSERRLICASCLHQLENCRKLSRQREIIYGS
jgi:hypothetical protein